MKTKLTTMALAGALMLSTSSAHASFWDSLANAFSCDNRAWSAFCPNHDYGGIYD